MRHALLSLALLLMAAAPAAAQPHVSQNVPKNGSKNRLWVSVSAGVQVLTPALSDTFTLPQFVENETLSVRYPWRAGVLVAGSGGYRVWKGLGIGVGASVVRLHGSAQVGADIPHPFFFNQFRHVDGTAAVDRTETATNLMVAWATEVSRHVWMNLAAGPSVVRVHQALVDGILYSQVYPYDTATFTGATTAAATRTALGINASVDVFWMFGRHVGAGGLLQVVHARVTQNRGAGAPAAVGIGAGSAQAGAGLRFMF